MITWKQEFNAKMSFETLDLRFRRVPGPHAVNSLLLVEMSTTPNRKVCNIDSGDLLNPGNNPVDKAYMWDNVITPSELLVRMEPNLSIFEMCLMEMQVFL